MKFTNPHANTTFGEEYQELDVRFAFVTETLPKEVKTLHNFVKCRDFLSDAIYWKHKKIHGIEVYGFKLDSLDLQQISPFIAIKADPNKIDRLELNGIIPGNFYWVDRPEKNIALISLPEYSVINPINISLSSLIIKLLTVLDIRKPFKEQINLLPKKEQGYIKEIGLPLIEEVTKKGLTPHLPRSVLTWDNQDAVNKLDPYTLHDNLGIVSCFKPYSPDSNIKQYFLKLKKQVEDIEKSKHKSIDTFYNSTTSTTTWNYLNQVAAADQPIEGNPVLMAALHAQIVGL